MTCSSHLPERDRGRIARAAIGATVVWDFDGVIADSEPMHADSYVRLLSSMGNDVSRFDFRAYVGHTEPRIWSMIARDGYKLAVPVAEAIQARNAWFTASALEGLAPTWLVSCVNELVGGVASRQVVASNGDPDTIRTLLGAWGLDYLKQLNPHAVAGGKKGLLRQLWQSGPTMTIEDNQEYLRLAGEAGSWRIGVRHSLNVGSTLDAEVKVSI